ncbi:hypothetical protein [Rothia nasimurium]|uniref:hypothetical protein n=1 Tax=Rothia nasimurium TaxID=85336 RepID=UPI001F397616|nr:hypothetical protein [Rothia nasimurium]
MSETVDSYEGQVPPEVYRRRRIVALLALVIVLLIIIGLIRMIVGGGNDSNQVASTATSTTTSAEPFSDFSERATESAEPSESADPSASADVTETAEASETASADATETPEATPSETAEPTETPEATPTPSETAATVTACSAADIKVNLTADAASYAAGQLPALAVTVTNSGSNPCTVTGGLNNIDINITSGPAQVYNYAQCHAVAGEDAELAAGVANTTSVTWDRTMNVLGCGTTKTIPAGHFWATATVNGVSSQPVRLIVNG